MREQIVEAFNNAPPNSKIYLGSDSVRYKNRKGIPIARITVVAVVHLGGRHGCKVFGKTVKERVYDKDLGRPNHRMMLEAFEVSKLYLELKEELKEVDIEVHLDVNPDERHGSSCAATQAAGYILGTCLVKPKLKPEAWAASTAADLYVSKLG